MKSKHVITAIAVIAAATAGVARSSSTPVGALPPGTTSSIETHRGDLVAIALPRTGVAKGLVWRLARNYDARVVHESREATLGDSVVIVFRVVGRGRTSIIYAQTRGDTSSQAVAAARYSIRAS
jgi:hypothetical protein